MFRYVWQIVDVIRGEDVRTIPASSPVVRALLRRRFVIQISVVFLRTAGIPSLILPGLAGISC
jgi:hypothetical protein